jgi:phage virion morphogenesis protein
MSGATIRLEAELLGASRPGLRFAALMMRMGDLTPVMDSIGAAVEDSVAHRFASGVGPDGKAWTKSQRAEAEGGRTLIDTGRLRQSITRKAGRQQVEVGTNLIYAGIHQFGGRGGRGHALTLPARPYLGLNAEDEHEIEQIVTDWLGRLDR